MLELPGNATFADSGVRQSGKVRLSRLEFNKQVQSYLTSITESRPSLKLAFLLFDIEDHSILPVQCKKALQSLQEIDEPVQKFSKLLREVEYLPVIITALRYRPLSILNMMDKQIDMLQNLIKSYSALCISPSQHEKQLRKEVRRSFEKLLQYNTNISEQVRALNDEAENQEQKLLSLTDNP